MSEPQAYCRPAWARIPFPSGWSSDRVQTLTPDDFSQVPEEERKRLWGAIRKFPFSSEYTKIKELNAGLLQADERLPTPPAYVPPGWTAEQARGFDLNLVTKLSEEEHRLWAAGKVADDVRRAQKQNQLPASAPGYIPAGWTTEQATCPDFELLSRLSKQDLTRFMQARNETNKISAAAPAPLKMDAAPSPLVQTLQRAGFPPWGFVMVRTYYGSESRWEEFQKKLDAMCDGQLNDETGDGLEKVQKALEFKIIEDPRLKGSGVEDARRHFHVAKAMGGVAVGMDISVLLVGDVGAVDSVLNDDATDESVPYITAVDVTEPGELGGFPGHFKVSIDSLLCELYPKVSMGLSPRSLWSMIEEADGIWTGDDT
ncbi:hypothetical protein F5B20DRAFT_341154 [Whalleya microplaca]|nr:hypothetical protein F5B20DRAFT_341154 [Whalleya microplaca]